jgi:hypothetical protein
MWHWEGGVIAYLPFFIFYSATAKIPKSNVRSWLTSSLSRHVDKNVLSKLYPHLAEVPISDKKLLCASCWERFEVLTSKKNAMLVLRAVTRWRLVDWYRSFEGTYCLLLGPEDGDSGFLRNVGIYLQVHAALQLRRPKSTRIIKLMSHVLILTWTGYKFSFPNTFTRACSGTNTRNFNTSVAMTNRTTWI